LKRTYSKVQITNGLRGKRKQLIFKAVVAGGRNPTQKRLRIGSYAPQPVSVRAILGAEGERALLPGLRRRRVTLRSGGL